MNDLKSGEPRREAGTGSKQRFQSLRYGGSPEHNIGAIQGIYRGYRGFKVWGLRLNP